MLSGLSDSQFWGFSALAVTVLAIVGAWILTSVPFALLVARIIGTDPYERPVDPVAMQRFRDDETREAFDDIVRGLS